MPVAITMDIGATFHDAGGNTVLGDDIEELIRVLGEIGLR